jgi:hypothetical protein
MKLRQIVFLLIICAVFISTFYLAKHNFSQRVEPDNSPNKETKILSIAEKAGEEFCNCMQKHGAPKEYDYALAICEGEAIKKYPFLRLFYINLDKPYLKDDVTREQFYKHFANFGEFQDYLEKNCSYFTTGPTPQSLADCKCEENPNPSSYNFLFKICNHIKKNKLNVYPASPCGYQIRDISEVTLDNGKLAIRVDLDCCYLGGGAFFDKETKELTHFWVGDK